ncbi:MAG: hypothetical protein V2J20_13565 [Wenzhouxiangella sp.]|jgi:hypothetical protein|nr:hypothetical protein [Wenzhouxiangella sp.]
MRIILALLMASAAGFTLEARFDVELAHSIVGLFFVLAYILLGGLPQLRRGSP